MSLRVTVLSSGSKGNLLHLDAGELRVLVDQGLSCKAAEARFHYAGLNPNRVDAILVTHEHSDHVRGISVFSRRYRVPVYISRTAYEAFEAQAGDPDWHEMRFIDAGKNFELGSLSVRPFRISHDTCDPLAYVFENKGRRFACATDLGYAPDAVRDELSHAHTLLLESNHDETMLREGSYPGYLKRRIASNKGHLSNRQTADLLRRLPHRELSKVILAHLSEENNTPILARASAEPILAELNPKAELFVARQDLPLRAIEV